LKTKEPDALDLQSAISNQQLLLVPYCLSVAPAIAGSEPLSGFSIDGDALGIAPVGRHIRPVV
jgi:hypothetical protein